MIIFVIILIAAIMAAFMLFNNKNTTQQEQPTKFELLDDNGDPIPKDPVIQELQYFCLKDKGYHVTVWPKDRGIGDHIEFNIAGLKHRENIIKYVGEHVGTLEPEPTNPYDPNAIKILAADGHHVGYVPKNTTQSVRNFTKLPCQCYIYIGTYFDAEGLNFYSSCYITDDAPNVSPNN